MRAWFYDIESLSNVFTLANYKSDTNEIDIFHLIDTPALRKIDMQVLKDRIYERNSNFRGEIHLYDLHGKGNQQLIETFGLCDAELPWDKTTCSGRFPWSWRTVYDTDADYDENKHPYLFGYNSRNYDTTMLALYFAEMWRRTAKSMTAKLMREHNDTLFTNKYIDNMPSYLRHFDTNNLAPNAELRAITQRPTQTTSNLIRMNMLLSGRNLDVARLNEKQSRVGLKRLLGMLGLQILESDKLATNVDHVDTLDQLYDLIAYNVSDVVNLEELLKHKAYSASFELKKGLLQTYPELVYDRRSPDSYEPDVRPDNVRLDRLTIDSSSAQFATKSLCPYDNLDDDPVVSFLYPSEKKAAELGVPRVNVLEESKKFFYRNFTQPELRAKFDEIYNYYKWIEGKNFNASKSYERKYNQGDHQGDYEVRHLSQIPVTNTCMFYYNADGTPSSCFVTFSTGGIHGAEYNKALYDHDVEMYNRRLALMDEVKAKYPDPRELKRAKTVLLSDGRWYSATGFLKTGATMKKAEYRDLSSSKPELFRMDKNGHYKIDPKYVFTSADETNHEDFKSYYPNMLRQMSAFWNDGLGYDRYAEIFDNKEKYGVLMKDKTITPEQRENYSVLRNGTKLILNSASGAGDANFDSAIRMNNRIIAMRCIGQMFSWRIGQAQTIAGARIISTNTDGLYSVLEAELNDRILDSESADIGVLIEPERTYLISKDSNNRIESQANAGLEGKIEAVSGGTLACRKGPDPTKSLAHPAVLDWALTEYLRAAAMHAQDNIGLDKPFVRSYGRDILERAKTEFGSPQQTLLMFQNVIASSTSSNTYIFGLTDTERNKPIIMQHYNRVFIMKNGTPGCVHLQSATIKKLPPATVNKRMEEYQPMQQHDPMALEVLEAQGITKDDIPEACDAAIKKVSNIDPEWYMYISNKALRDMTQEEQDFILDNLDIEKYLGLLSDGFTRNWQNETPNENDTPFPLGTQLYDVDQLQMF